MQAQDPAVRERNACAKLADFTPEELRLLIGRELTPVEMMVARTVLHQVRRSIMARGNATQRARGVATALDLRERSIRIEGSDCWLWTGANDGRHGVPRIRTVDYDTGEDRVMPGPRAVLNITGRRALGPGRPMRTCPTFSCVNPAHHQLQP